MQCDTFACVVVLKKTVGLEICSVRIDVQNCSLRQRKERSKLSLFIELLKDYSFSNNMVFKTIKFVASKHFMLLQKILCIQSGP
jgi:hypothetical protein